MTTKKKRDTRASDVVRAAIAARNAAKLGWGPEVVISTAKLVTAVDRYLDYKNRKKTP